MAYKVVSGKDLRERGFDLHISIDTTIIVDNAYFNCAGMVVVEGGSFDDVPALDGLGGLIFNMTPNVMTFEKDGVVSLIPPSGIGVFTIHDFKEVGDICGIPKYADLPRSNLELIPNNVPVIVSKEHWHKARGRSNTYVARVDKTKDTAQCNGIKRPVFRINNLISYS